MRYLRILCNCTKYPHSKTSFLAALPAISKEWTRFIYASTVTRADHSNETTTQDTGKEKPWRTPYYQRDDEWYSALSLFAPKKGNNPDIIRFLQSPIDFRPVKIRAWWNRKMKEKDMFDQRFITERHEILGNDLAAAHFVVHRGGTVKFVNQKDWVKQDEDGEYSLPRTYRPDFILEAIDASNMNIYYEGLVNMVHLRKLQWLSFKGCKHIDDWCIDRISGEFQSSLEYLDLSDCPLVTDRALAVMYRMRKLKILKLNNIVTTKSFELACLLLEEMNPNLSIEGVTYMNIEEKVDVASTP